MSEKEELIRLQLKQARRREFPFNLAKVFFLGCMVIVLCSALGNCGAGIDTEKPLTKEQIQKNTQAIWGGHTEAHKARLP